jgi:hypothetical protein
MSLEDAYTNADSIAPQNQPPGPDDVQLVQAYCNYYVTGSADSNSPECIYQPSN